jgi:hypothetical protein
MNSARLRKASPSFGAQENPVPFPRERESIAAFSTVQKPNPVCARHLLIFRYSDWTRKLIELYSMKVYSTPL